MLTEQDVKKMEAQIQDIEAEIKKYYQATKARKILENEEKIIGRVYKKVSDELNGTVYLKPISALNRDAPYRMECLEFLLPLNPTLNWGKEFNHIDDDFFMWYDSEMVSDLNNSKDDSGSRTYRYKITEITQEEYSKALDEYFKQLRELPQKYFRLVDVKGEEYVENIKKEDKEMWEETKE